MATATALTNMMRLTNEDDKDEEGYEDGHDDHDHHHCLWIVEPAFAGDKILPIRSI